MPRILRAIIIVLVILTACVFIFRGALLKGILSGYLRSQLNLEVDIKRAYFGSASLISLEDVEIKNRKGLYCNIEKADINYSILSIIKYGTNFKFRLNNVDLSYPDSAIINGISGFLSVKPVELLKFDNVSGELFFKAKELVMRGVSSEGRLIRLFVDGTIKSSSVIDCSFKMELSPEIVANIPEATRNIFFKQGQGWPRVDLYLSGDIKQPSINFSTDLFKLIVR